MRRATQLVLIAAAFLFIGLQSSHAQATRTWVSGLGDDANPCSRTAPCKTFAGAISKTAAKGEINVLDPGGFGGVTITKSIAIISDSVEAGVLVAGTNAIIVNVLATDKVYLRGLNIDGTGTGLAGVKIISPGTVVINKCVIRNFLGASSVGIFAVPSTGLTKLFVSECSVDNNNHGIILQPTGTGIVSAAVDRTTITNHSNSGSVGLSAQGTGTSALLNNSVITGNARGITTASSGKVFSLGNNMIYGNQADEATSQVVPQN